ncbi:MAG: hypothetical protein IJT54_05125 [Candidatus Methanomethylophilaceae archaeon]|nr:hypothetical protein [Candidatus Methanomethylophilaceae archaeon]
MTDIKFKAQKGEDGIDLTVKNLERFDPEIQKVLKDLMRAFTEDGDGQ